MGKNWCKVEKKWCRFMRHGSCGFCKNNIDSVARCPRLVEIETVRLSDLLKETDFESVFSSLCKWFNDQEPNKSGYKKVFDEISKMTPKKHKLSDIFISLEKVIEEDGEEWIDVHGVNVIGTDKTTYAIEFYPWDTWISLFVTKDTLDTFSKEEIVAGCLYEMTFFGYEEEDVREQEEKLINTIEETKKLINSEKSKSSL